MRLIDTTNYVSSRDTNTNVVAARIGSIATFLFSVVSFISILILPLMASKAPQQTIGWTKAPIGSDEKSTSRMISLQNLWALSHALFTICMFSTIFVQSPTAAAIPIAVVGISGGINSWAPHALVNLEIVRLQADDILEGFTEDGVNGGDSTCPRTPAGVILGLHNVAISVPQIIAAFGCWVLTQVLQKVGVSDEFGWMFRFASIATATATYLAWKLK
jgi:solute carrier family 45, member 1/2/4